MDKGSFDSQLNIIKYWIDIELSAPPIIKLVNTKKSDLKWNQIISFNHNDDITWLSPLVEKLENPSEWLHTVYLGIFNTELVIKEFSEDIQDINELKHTHQTCLLSFVMDSKGIPIKGSIKIPEYISSIAYAKTHNKNEYNPFEERVKDLFSTWTYTIQKNKSSADKNDLLEFMNLVLSELKWDLLIDTYKNNEFGYLAYSESISTNKNRKYKFDSEITSSLLADDLKKVEKFLETYESNSSLKYYLSKDYNEIDYKDVVRNRKYSKETHTPSKIPDVCWPTKNSSKLVSSQQFAVNKIFEELSEEGLFSVNGPPGTGKTTLLRDVIANIIYKRAEELYKFKNNPDEAMGEIGKITYKFSGKGEKSIYGLHHKLSGFEIVVASSNNGAVENITKELPASEEIESKYLNDIKYLEEIANNVNSKESWGLISATLGNKQNNYNFSSNFLFKNTDDEGNEKRSIFDFLKDYRYFDEKILSWQDACKNFKEKQDKVKKIKNDLEIIYSAVNNSKEYLDIYNKLKEEHTKKKEKLKNTENILVKLVNEAKELKKIIESSDNKGITNLFKQKKSEIDKNDDIINAKNEFKIKAMKISEYKNEREITISEISSLKSSIEKQTNILNHIKKIKNDFKEKDVKGIPGNAFWDKEEEYIQKYSPFLTNEFNNARKELFIASLTLHKSFIIENSEKVSSNMRLFKEILDGEFFEGDKYYQAIWETFFLIVPVISTTFSSLGNLFANMKENSIGWLLVDEAGQSTPQAPVGGLWRSKRAIFVGDPLQIEPVLSVEKKLSDVLIKKNNIGFNWNAYNFSAQRIADRNNKWGTVFGNGSHSIWVGCPLRVHRRCDEPMFSISNKIAYDNTMIFGKNQPTNNPVKEILGYSQWFNIKGEALKDSHWIPEEGNKLIELLINIKENYVGKLPNVYIISPFKSVAYESQRLLAKRKKEWADESISDTEIASWINSSVGTIHSFQGKEVDIVFLILGGNIIKSGAINWVCEEPNILNVAVTRARHLFYIIGDSTIWNKGVFGLVKQYIKVDKKIEKDKKEQ